MNNLNKIIILTKCFTHRINLELTISQIDSVNELNKAIPNINNSAIYEYCDPIAIMQKSFFICFGRQIEKNKDDSKIIKICYQLSKFNKYKMYL